MKIQAIILTTCLFIFNLTTLQSKNKVLLKLPNLCTNAVSNKDNNINTLGFNISPNPSKGNLNIEIVQVLNDKASLSIINGLGQEVFQMQIAARQSKIELNLGSLSNGFYLLQLKSADRVVFKKLLIKK